MKILYATDGMAPALDAGRLLERIARREGAEVTVVSVAYAGVPALEHAVFHMDPLPDRREAAIGIVDHAVEQLRAAGFSARARVIEGHPAREILRLIDEEWFDVTMVGGSVRSWAGRNLLGSVSSHVLHESPSSVVVVHHLLNQRDKAQVLLATDGSRGSDKAVQWLGSFADPDRCEIDVVSVAHPQESYFHPVPGALEPGEDERIGMDLNEAALRTATRIAHVAAAPLESLGFEVSSRAVLGEPVEAILKEAEAGGCDLIAMGARGLNAWDRVRLGSVSDQVARHVNAAFVARRFVSPAL